MFAHKEIVSVNELRQTIVKFVEAVKTDNPPDLILFAVSYFTALREATDGVKREPAHTVTSCRSNTAKCEDNEVITSKHSRNQHEKSDNSNHPVSQKKHNTPLVDLHKNLCEMKDMSDSSSTNKNRQHPTMAVVNDTAPNNETPNTDMMSCGGGGEMLTGRYSKLAQALTHSSLYVPTDSSRPDSDITPNADWEQFEQMCAARSYEWTQSAAMSCEVQRRRHSEKLLTTLPSLTEHLNQYDVMVLADTMKSKITQHGHIIFSPGDVADEAYFIKSGSVKYTVTDEANYPAIVHSLKPGDSFGLTALSRVESVRRAEARAEVETSSPVTSVELVALHRGMMTRLAEPVMMHVAIGGCGSIKQAEADIHIAMM
jgi:hypothetical protein